MPPWRRVVRIEFQRTPAMIGPAMGANTAGHRRHRFLAAWTEARKISRGRPRAAMAEGLGRKKSATQGMIQSDPRRSVSEIAQPRLKLRPDHMFFSKARLMPVTLPAQSHSTASSARSARDLPMGLARR